MAVPYEIKSPLHRAFVENIRARREDLGLTQADVASRMKIATCSYTQIENGRRMPTLETVERVAKALRTPSLDLLGAEAAVTA